MSTVFWGFCDKPQKDETIFLCQALAAAKTEEIKAGTKQIETKKEEKVPQCHVCFLGGVFFLKFPPRIPAKMIQFDLRKTLYHETLTLTAMNLVVFTGAQPVQANADEERAIKKQEIKDTQVGMLLSQAELMGRSEMIFLVPVPLESWPFRGFFFEWLTEMYLMINLHSMHICYMNYTLI